ncbi:S10 family peptidase CYBJADRAFT_169538 [Cyberlindnera jadinii NRRL Y-1542]|uniref:Carboxypeptidase n=1 Tax=Cyberlindnera jadinii (strain ATCC 18201 / CBS 1600 / BCRC 20928 / JCM 3617 / NBRC 0987 / NRRL Y-1542) TaxID=983966 RepID=A0A1E4RVK7_CYBJN|nr:hypothetical protein CYBJADRAFT_169538 [Cyberlindnera jadinii NRRL Y-1542]ODV71319.1 hypothetical protein CYBJADRAFT_169538 [Cyberlindnera jadinii NRRL Y-1542]
MKLKTLLLGQLAYGASLNSQSPLGDVTGLLSHAGASLSSLRSSVGGETPALLKAWTELLKSHSIGEMKGHVDDFYEGKFWSSPRNLHQERVFSKASEADERYDVLTLDKYSGYALRTSKKDPYSLGIDTVKQYSGYLDQGDNHFFYYFFESRNDPANDPVILWLNGGPGCSSMTGLFFELGPSSIGEDLKPVYNPYSWNSNASVIFLEQPIGVGYSYGEEEVTNSYAAAKDVFVFLELFFQKFPKFASNDFHVAGESYAGHYIPAIASEIINHADRSFELTSVLIGNGITDSLVQNDYYEPMACGKGGYKPVLEKEQCEGMQTTAKRCSQLTKACYKAQSAFACVPAMLYCNRLLEPYVNTGLNVYDIRGPCDGGESLCYKGLDYVEQYLNLPSVQEALGSEVEKYVGCSDTVGSRFVLTGDEAKPFQGYITELLESGYPVLIYAGDKDFICNWLGNHGWTDDLEWLFAPTYRELQLQPWINSAGEHSGEVKSFGGLTFLRVFDAGHMVPYDQPFNALDMVNAWISGNQTFGY